MKTTITTMLLAFAMNAAAQDFNTYFVDKTLRIDYSFSGNVTEQHIAVDELKQSPRWYGKRKRLAELPMEGNGQITVKDHKTGDTIIATPSLPFPRMAQLS